MRLRLVILAALLLIPCAAQAQIISPPNAWHPYRGGTNCVQVADSSGFFNCSPLVTVNPATGKLVSVLGGPISTAISMVIGPATNTFQALGNDLVINTSTVAPAGPGVGGAVLRIRQSPLIPGYCRAVLAGGNSYGTEFPIALWNPAAPFAASASAGFGLGNNYVIDFPGGAGGC